MADNKSESKDKKDKKSNFELSVELVKALAWPLFSLIVLIGFFGPLRSTAKQLPDILNRSNVITIGGLSLDVGRNIQAKATPEVEEVLKDLSSDGISDLLDLTSGSFYTTKPSQSTINKDLELINLGLAQLLSGEELQAGNKTYEYGIRITPLGEETKEFLFAIIEELIQEIKAAEEEA